MKKNRSLVNVLVACGMAFAMVSTLAAQEVAEMGAKVVRIAGSARYTLDNKDWQPLKVGMILKSGAVIQTGKAGTGSFVDLVLLDTSIPRPAVFKPAIPNSYSSYAMKAMADQNVLRLKEDTALGIDKLTSQMTGTDVVTDTQLDLKMGKIVGSVKKMSAASRYEVKLPTGVAGIRGTSFEIDANGTLNVTSGSVVIAYTIGGVTTTTEVGAGQSFNLPQGATQGQVSVLDTTTGANITQVVAAVQAAAAATGTTISVNINANNNTIENTVSPK